MTEEKEFLKIYEALLVKTPAPKAICWIKDIDEIDEDEHICDCPYCEELQGAPGEMHRKRCETKEGVDWLRKTMIKGMFTRWERFKLWIFRTKI